MSQFINEMGEWCNSEDFEPQKHLKLEYRKPKRCKNCFKELNVMKTSSFCSDICKLDYYERKGSLK